MGSARKYTHEGKTMTLMEWAEKCGLKYSSLHYRLCHGWTLREALSTPLDKQNRVPGTRKTKTKLEELQFIGYARGNHCMFAMYRHPSGWRESFTEWQLKEGMKNAG